MTLPTDPNPNTQGEQVLALLRHAGPAGVCVTDLLDHINPRTGLRDPITRGAARVHELRALGWPIDTDVCVDHGHRAPLARYTLRRPELSAGQDGLFDPGPARHRHP